MDLDGSTNMGFQVQVDTAGHAPVQAARKAGITH